MLIQGTINARDVHKTYVYGLFDNGKLVFCDGATLPEIFTLKNARFAGNFKPTCNYNIVVFESADNEIEAQNKRLKYIRHYLGDKMPEINFEKAKTRTKVLCKETGQIFESPYDVCKKLGLNAGLVYPHLAGDRAHQSVKGYHYIYVYPETPERACEKPVVVSYQGGLVVDDVLYTKPVAIEYAKRLGGDHTLTTTECYVMKVLLSIEEIFQHYKEGETCEKLSLLEAERWCKLQAVVGLLPKGVSDEISRLIPSDEVYASLIEQGKQDFSDFEREIK